MTINCIDIYFGRLLSMKMMVKFFILCGIAFYDAKIFCSQKKFGPVHVTRFASHVVDDTTHFDYPELEQGFAIVGKDFQQFMKAKLVGKDFQDQMVADDGLKSTALHDVIMQAQQTIVDGCKSDVQKVLLDVADKKVEEDTIYNQKFNYVQRYKDVLQLDACLYDWPVFKEGFDLLDDDEHYPNKNFYEYVKKNIDIDRSCMDLNNEGEKSSPAFDEAHYMLGYEGKFGYGFIDFIRKAQSEIVDELQEKLAEPIKNTIEIGGDLYDVADSKMQYLLKYVDVEFIHKGLQKMFMGNDQELDTSDFIFNVLRTDNIKMFECLLKKKIIIADYQYEKGVTILGHSCQLGSAKIVKKIIGLSVDVNQPLLLLPLHAAVCNGQYEIVKILLESGADFDRLDCYARSVKDFMQDNKMKNIFQLYAAKKILQEIDHVETFSEQERVLKLQKGFALLGQDYQKLVNEQLAGRHPDEPVFYESSSQSNRTVLENSLNALTINLVESLRTYFVACVAKVIEDKSDLDIEIKHNQMLQYIDTYYGRVFRANSFFDAYECLDRSVQQGLSLLDQSTFNKYNSLNFSILNDQGNIRQEFKDIVHEAQEKIVNELETPFLIALQRCYEDNVSLDTVTDLKVRYLLDHKDVPFIKRALKELVSTKKRYLFQINHQDCLPLSLAIYNMNAPLVKELLELGADPSVWVDYRTSLNYVLCQISTLNLDSFADKIQFHHTLENMILMLFAAGADMDQKNLRGGPSAWDQVFFKAYHYPEFKRMFIQERQKEKYQLRDRAYRRKEMILVIAGIIGALNLSDLITASKK